MALDLARNICIFDSNHTSKKKGVEIAASERSVFKDELVVYCLSNFAKAYDYYKNVLGRNSVDDAGGNIIVYANYRTKECEANNTDWSNAHQVPDGDKSHFCVGAGKAGGFAKGLDVIAHEYTHGVMYHTVKKPLKGICASAIGEGYADILGGIVEEANSKGEWWIHGESYSGDTNGSRNLKAPLLTKNPEIYKGARWYEGDDTEKFDHHNSTVIGHAAYLIQQELSLSLDELANLWYESIKTLGSSNDDFYEVRMAVIQAARSRSYEENQIVAIENIFDRVGIYATKAEYTPPINEGSYNYRIRGIVIAGDSTATFKDNKPLENYNLTFTPKVLETVSIYEDGAFSVGVDIQGSFTLTFEKEGYVSETIKVDVDEDSLLYNLGYIELMPNELSGEGGASGTIYDAMSWKAIEGLSLKIRKGKNSQRGAVVARCETDVDGYYECEDLEAGLYCVQVWDEREDVEEPYEVQYFNLKVVGDTTLSGQNAYLNRAEYKRNYEGHTYQLFGIPMLWEEAELYCEELGGHLVTVKGEEENDFLAQWLRERDVSYCSIGLIRLQSLLVPTKKQSTFDMYLPFRWC